MCIYLSYYVRQQEHSIKYNEFFFPDFSKWTSSVKKKHVYSQFISVILSF